MQAFYKGSIIVAGLAVLAMGQLLFGLAILALGIFVIVAFRPVDKAFDEATENEDPAGQVAAMGWGALISVIALAALAFIINGVMPGGSGVLR